MKAMAQLHITLNTQDIQNWCKEKVKQKKLMEGARDVIPLSLISEKQEEISYSAWEIETLFIS